MILTEPRQPRAVSAPLLAEMTGHHAKHFQVIPDPVKALETAIELATTANAVFATGSLYLVGDLRAYWHRRWPARSRAAKPVRPPKPRRFLLQTVDIAFHSKIPQQIGAIIRFCADIAHLNQLRTPSFIPPADSIPTPARIQISFVRSCPLAEQLQHILRLFMKRMEQIRMSYV